MYTWLSLLIYYTDLHPDNLDEDAFKKGIIFSHGTALDGTRMGELLLKTLAIYYF